MAITVYKADGCVLTCSSWAAWRHLQSLHSVVPCGKCSGEGQQYWLIEGGDEVEDRWYPQACKACAGRGAVLPLR